MMRSLCSWLLLCCKARFGAACAPQAIARDLKESLCSISPVPLRYLSAGVLSSSSGEDTRTWGWLPLHSTPSPPPAGSRMRRLFGWVRGGVGVSMCACVGGWVMYDVDVRARSLRTFLVSC